MMSSETRHFFFFNPIIIPTYFVVFYFSDSEKVACLFRNFLINEDEFKNSLIPQRFDSIEKDLLNHELLQFHKHVSTIHS